MKIDGQLLAKALMNCNNQFMEQLPDSVELHSFSGKFEKKMNRLISAEKKYGGHIWLEKITRYTTKIAVLAVFLIMVNFVSVKAFDVNIWQVLVSKTGEFIQINFRQSDSASGNPEEEKIMGAAVRMKIINLPDGYEQQGFYQADDMTVQHLVSGQGTITYTESLITGTANINIAEGSEDTDTVGGWQVGYICEDDAITAFFCDDEFYHIVEIQGRDANKNFADKIIEELEEQ